MIDKGKIEKLVWEYIQGTQLFMVAVKVSNSNRITVLADKMSGITIEDCANLHRFLEKRLDSEPVDFELQVSSPGLEMPFGVIEQYYKNEGNKVSVVNNEGQKYSGTLKNVTAGGFEIETEIKVKGKVKEHKDISFNFDQVKTTKVVLTIS
jgi:ribosome maturation factor RimP